MIIAILIMIVGLFITLAYLNELVTSPWFLFFGQSAFVTGLLVAEGIWVDITERIKKLENKKGQEKENDLENHR